MLEIKQEWSLEHGSSHGPGSSVCYLQTTYLLVTYLYWHRIGTRPECSWTGPYWVDSPIKGTRVGCVDSNLRGSSSWTLSELSSTLHSIPSPRSVGSYTIFRPHRVRTSLETLVHISPLGLNKVGSLSLDTINMGLMGCSRWFPINDPPYLRTVKIETDTTGLFR